jgi:hypothetical protein
LPSAQRTVDGKIIVPGRLYDNIQSGYAVFVGWQDLVNNPVQLKSHISDAKTRPRHMIVNSRERQLQNS